MRPGRPRVTRVLVLTGIVGMHGALLLWFTGTAHCRAGRTDVADALPVRFLLLPAPPAEPRLADDGSASGARAARAPRLPTPNANANAAATEKIGDATAPGVPGIDWSRAAERVAGDAARAPGAVPACEPTGRPDSKLPPCPARGKKFEWRREPRAVEFSGVLPYVRLGKRCVVGLGFFGCGIGTLPEANGALFDGMQDADRERSSVPDVPR